PARRQTKPEVTRPAADARRPEPPPVEAGGRSATRPRPPDRPSAEEGLKGFRDVVAEAETLGEATAQAAKSAREAYVAVPGSDPELDRLEPRVEPIGLRAPIRESPLGRPADPMPRGAEPRGSRSLEQ